MLKKIAAASLLVLASTSAMAGQQLCMPMDGLDMPTFSQQTAGTVRTSAQLIGGVSAANGIVLIFLLSNS